MAKGAFRGGSYGGGGFGGGVNKNVIKQAQKMQQDMLKMQEALEQETYEASAGGVVKAAVSGKGELVSLTIAPEAVDPEDVEMLQDTIIAAVNEAFRKAEAAKAESMGKLTGSFDLSGLGF